MLSSDLIKGADAAAEYSGGVLTAKQVYRMAALGQLPVTRKGRSLYFRKSELERAFTSEATA